MIIALLDVLASEISDEDLDDVGILGPRELGVDAKTRRKSPKLEI